MPYPKVEERATKSEIQTTPLSKRLLDNLDVLDIVVVNEEIDLFNNLLRAAIAKSWFAKKGVDATKAAFKWTAETCVYGHVGLAIMDSVKTMPVVGSVFLNRQKVPGWHG